MGKNKGKECKRGPLDIFFKPQSKAQKVDSNQVVTSLPSENEGLSLDELHASPSLNQLDASSSLNQVCPSLSSEQVNGSSSSSHQRVALDELNVSCPSNDPKIHRDQIEECIDLDDVDVLPSSEPIDEDAYVNFERDPGLRRQICSYPVNQREDVRRAYLRMGPYRPKFTNYPLTKDATGKQHRAFNKSWYDKFHWLEYSPTKDRAYCFHCFVFEESSAKHSVYTMSGFNSWKYVNGAKCSFVTHVGGLRSPHMVALTSCQNLLKSSRHIDNVMKNISSEEILKNRMRIRETIYACLWLALQGFSFKGHDESKESGNRGNIIELISYQAKKNPAIAAVVLGNAPGNAIYTAPSVQKKLLHIMGERVRMKIREEVGDAKFCILVDEAQDNADKEQMAIILRFVDEMGFVRERFFNIVGVNNTSSLTLKRAISNVLAYHNLEVENMRGQGYDGASNMRGAWNGLQALFLQECPYAYYVHCFAHRLQLALVAAARENNVVWQFFSKLGVIVNLVGASPKRKMELQKAKEDELMYLKALGELESGKGVNQNRTLQRAGATRWSSHFASISSLIYLYDAASMVLQGMSKKGSTSSIRGEASGSYTHIRSFDFVFILHLLHQSMGITNLLCKALQSDSNDILNAMSLVFSIKTLLQDFKNEGWDKFLQDVTSFCAEHAIQMPKMDNPYVEGTGRRCQQHDSISLEHHYYFDIFIKTLDYQLMELGSRFSEDVVELLTLSTALSPANQFNSFKVEDICQLVEKFYPQDFSEQEVFDLKNQLEHYRCDVVLNPHFHKMSTISELCRGLVETRKHKVYTLVDKLIRLNLTLPVSTATTERAFSVMKRIKTDLRNRMEDDFLKDCMTLNIERGFANGLDLESVIDEYDDLENHRVRFR